MGSVHKRVRKSKKQQIWAFMRRNRQFRAGDLMMILDVTQGYLMPIFRALELCDYLHLEAGTEYFKERIYRLNLDTGVRSPVILKKPCDIVRDLNTGDEFILDGNHPVQISDKLRMLMAMRKKFMLSEEIAKGAGMHKYSVKAIRYTVEFVNNGVIERTVRSKAHKKFSTYKINPTKRDEMIRSLGGSA